MRSIKHWLDNLVNAGEGAKRTQGSNAVFYPNGVERVPWYCL